MFGPKWRRWDLPTHSEWSILHYARFQHLLDEPFGRKLTVTPGFVAARIQQYNSQSEISGVPSRLAKSPSRDFCHSAEEAGQSEPEGQRCPSKDNLHGQPECWTPKQYVSLYFLGRLGLKRDRKPEFAYCSKRREAATELTDIKPALRDTGNAASRFFNELVMGVV